MPLKHFTRYEFQRQQGREEGMKRRRGEESGTIKVQFSSGSGSKIQDILNLKTGRSKERREDKVNVGILEPNSGEEGVILLSSDEEVEQAPRYLGHPSGAVDEVKGIRDKRLSLLNDGEKATNS